MFRYILSSDSVISKLKRRWYSDVSQYKQDADQKNKQFSHLVEKYGTDDIDKLAEAVGNQVGPYVLNVVSKYGMLDNFSRIESYPGVFRVVFEYDTFTLRLEYNSRFGWQFDWHYAYASGAGDDVKQFEKSNPVDRILYDLEAAVDMSDMYFVTEYADNKVQGIDYLSVPYTHLLASLLYYKGKYIVVNSSNEYVKVASEARSWQWSDAYNVEVLVRNNDNQQLDLVRTQRLFLGTNTSEVVSDVGLPTDGSFPTVVAVEEIL